MLHDWWQGDGTEIRLCSRFAGDIRRTRDFHAVQPGDKSIIPIHDQAQSPERINRSVISNDCRMIKRRVAIQHIRQHRGIITIFVTKTAGPGEPGSIESRVCRGFPVGLRRTGALAVVPRSGMLDQRRWRWGCSANIYREYSCLTQYIDTGQNNEEQRKDAVPTTGMIHSINWNAGVNHESHRKANEGRSARPIKPVERKLGSRQTARPIPTSYSS